MINEKARQELIIDFTNSIEDYDDTMLLIIDNDGDTLYNDNLFNVIFDCTGDNIVIASNEIGTINIRFSDVKVMIFIENQKANCLTFGCTSDSYSIARA